jgi:hypothetical protein
MAEMTKVKSARALIYRAFDSLQQIFNVGEILLSLGISIGWIMKKPFEF